MAMEEPEQNGHRCTICGRTFESEEDLNTHVKDLGIVW